VAVAAAGVGLAVVAGAPGVARTPAVDLAAPPALASAVRPASAHTGGGTALLELAREVAPRVAAPAVPKAWPLPVASPAVVANPRTAWGPPVAVLDAARAAVAAMPLEVLAGQVMVARYTGPDPAVPAALVAGWHLGGVILMGENVVSLDQVRATTAAVHAAAQADGRTWPAVVAVDEEGGRVSRLRGLLADLPAFATFGASGDDAATHSRFIQLGADLASLGFTMDLAPVADVTIGPADPTIGDRSASLDPVVAGRTVVAAVTGLLDGGTVPVIKHFPGHGSVTTDSHAVLPLQPATAAELAVRDLVPFRVATASGAPVVMIGHLDVPALEPGVPASLSAATYRLLREDLGFEGVAVTDALDMGAVPASGDEAVRALIAGADLVLMPRDVATAHAAIVAAVQDGRLPLARLQEAATRVVALQMWTAQLRG
jgi:beta-N-acetylhexosaminidase